jgi:hypothetical protein
MFTLLDKNGVLEHCWRGMALKEKNGIFAFEKGAAMTDILATWLKKGVCRWALLAAMWRISVKSAHGGGAKV